MSIFAGSGTIQPKEIWYGNNKIKEVWVGDNKVWPLLVGPYSDADLYLNFNNPDNPSENLGVEGAPVLPEGGLLHEHDNLFVANTGKLQSFSNSNWANGYTVSMWTRDAPVNSGWKTVMHRAPVSGSLTNEAYVVQQIGTTDILTYSGLRLNNVAREYAATYRPSVHIGWFHTVVVWTRTSSTAFNCKFYIDGTLRGSFNATGLPANVQMQPTYPIFFGSGRDNDGFEWSGNMDDIALWSRSLTAAEVTELYTIGRSWLPRITTMSPMSFVVGEVGSMLLATNFSATTWTATGLPDGLILTTVGLLTGTPTTVGSGVMTLTASSDLYSATKAIAWNVIEVPSLTTHSIQARGANKISHSGWARPSVTWSIMYADDTGAFEPDGTLISSFGRGRVEATLTLTNGRSSRVVSNIKGVLATGSGTSQNYITSTMILEEGERLHLEIQDYSSNANDRFYLYIRAPA